MQPVKPAGSQPGFVGMKLAAGQIVTTTSGRPTSPFPKVEIDTNRKAANTIKRTQDWLITNAIEEASARDDGFNRRSFETARKSPSPADLDSAELYLFDPAFLRPAQPRFLKPLCAPTEAL